MGKQTQFAWDEEQAEEALYRFREATPTIQGSPMFACDVARANSWVYVPYVYHVDDATEKEHAMPHRYVAAIPNGDKFKIQMEGMFILLGVGIPAECLPSPVTLEELDGRIMFVWEQWFKLNDQLTR